MINDTSQRSVAIWFRCGETFDHYFITKLLFSLFWMNFYKNSAVAEMGDCLATIDMGRKLGDCPVLGELGPHVTQCLQGRGLPPYQMASWSIEPFGRSRHGPKIGGSGLCPFGWGGAGSPSKTMWPGPRPTSVPSFILIHPTVWPQYTNVTDRIDRQSDSIVQTVLQTVAHKSLNIWQSYGWKLVAWSAMCAGALSYWKMETYVGQELF